MSSELLAAVVGVLGVCIGACINFVINTSVKQGKLETRVDNAERDLNNLGAMVREQNKANRRAA